MSIEIALMLAAQGHASLVIVAHGQLGEARLVIFQHDQVLSRRNIQYVSESIIYKSQRNAPTDILAHRIELTFRDEIELELLDQQLLLHLGLVLFGTAVANVSAGFTVIAIVVGRQSFNASSSRCGNDRGRG